MIHLFSSKKRFFLIVFGLVCFFIYNYKTIFISFHQHNGSDKEKVLKNSLLLPPVRELHICRQPLIYLTNSTLQKPSYDTINTTFKCQGDAYKLLGEQIMNFHDNTTHNMPSSLQNNSSSSLTMESISESWGYHDTMLPGRNKSILLIGNSHTRQQLEALLCQYSDSIIDGRLYDKKSERTRADSGWVLLKNQHRIFWLFNKHIFYDTLKWKSNIEEYFNEKEERGEDTFFLFDDLTVIIVGTFNLVNHQTLGTSFYDEMIRQFELHNMTNSTAKEGRLPPSISMIAKEYNGTIIKATGFDFIQERKGDNEAQLQEMKEFKNRNFYYLDGRKYIKLLQNEGASDGSKFGVGSNCPEGSCNNNHRCSGEYGGIADIVVWYLVDLFHTAL